MGNIPPHLTFHDSSIHSYTASPSYSILLKARWPLMRFHSLIQQIFIHALPHSFRYPGMTVLVMTLGCHQQKRLHTKRGVDGRQENWPWETDRKQGSCRQPVSRKATSPLPRNHLVRMLPALLPQATAGYHHPHGQGLTISSSLCCRLDSLCLPQVGKGIGQANSYVHALVAWDRERVCLALLRFHGGR